MARAVGVSGSRARAAEGPVASMLRELAARLEELGRVQEQVRSAVEDEADDLTALDRLFAAVAKVNPRHAADRIRFLARFIESEAGM